jgi:hypothetical protein
LRSPDVAGGTSAERAGKSRDIECRRRQRRGRRHADRLTPPFLIVMQKDEIGNISRTETRVPARN